MQVKIKINQYQSNKIELFFRQKKYVKIFMRNFFSKIKKMGKIGKVTFKVVIEIAAKPRKYLFPNKIYFIFSEYLLNYQFLLSGFCKFVLDKAYNFLSHIYIHCPLP